jgi:mannose-6-phosphate isomerase-like protein (cupin superfamily)
MTFSVDSLVRDAEWVPLRVAGQQDNPTYLWEDGGTIKDAPIDYEATFGGNMFTSSKPLDIPAFNRNLLKTVPNWTVPRHLHNIDETIVVFQGEYKIQYDDPAENKFVIVKPGNVFVSRAGTPYTMTAGPEGVVYIETWGVPVTNLKTVWFDYGWVRREVPPAG